MIREDMTPEAQRLTLLNMHSQVVEDRQSTKIGGP